MLARVWHWWMLAPLLVLLVVAAISIQLGLTGLRLVHGRDDLLAGRFWSAKAQFTQARDDLQSNLLLSPLRLAPPLNRQLHALELLSDIGARAADAASAGLAAFHNQDLGKLSRVENDLRAMTADRLRIPQTGLVPSLRRTVSQLDAELQQARQLRSLMPMLQRLLGNDGSASYLVLQQDPAELRATGGFIGSVAFLDFNRGKLQPFQPIDIETIDGPHFHRTLGMVGGPRYVPPPKPFFRVLDPGDSWELRDENFSPDFPTSARLAEDLLRRETGRTTQGVIAVDPYLISDLLRLSGPVTVPETGDVLTSQNFFATTLRKVELHRGPTPRKSFLSYATSAVVDRLKSMPASNWVKVADVIKQACLSKDIQAYFDDPATEAVVNQFSCGGQVPLFKHDGLMVVDENLNSNKDDFWISRSFKLKIEPESNGSAIHTLQISYGPYPKLEQLTTPYIDWLRVYVPSGARLLRASGVEAQQTAELGNAVFEGWVQFGYGETNTVTFSYEVPGPLMEPQGGEPTLLWAKQAGRSADRARVEVLSSNRTQVRVLETNWSVAMP